MYFYADERYGDPIRFATEAEVIEGLSEVCKVNGWEIPEDDFLFGRDYYGDEAVFIFGSMFYTADDFDNMDDEDFEYFENHMDAIWECMDDIVRERAESFNSFSEHPSNQHFIAEYLRGAVADLYFG